MAFDIYDSGLDALADWEIATYEWVLLSSGTFQRTNPVVADVMVVSTEIAASGYSRLAAATKLRTVDSLGSRITYTCDDPDFGTLATGETVIAVLLIRVVTDDSDSIPVGWASITPTDTAAADPFVITITDGIVAYLDQAA